MSGSKYHRRGFSPNHPIIIVPGLCSSAMKVVESPHKDWINRRIWLDVTTIGFSKVLGQIPLIGSKSKTRGQQYDDTTNAIANNSTEAEEQNRRRWIAHMVLQSNGISDPPNIKVRPIETIDAIMYLDPGAITNALSYVFGPLIETLWEIGYTEGNLRAAPYDWRVPPCILEVRDSYFSRLKEKVDEMYSMENKKVVLIGHSLGTRCVHYFLRFCEKHFGRAWISRRIHTWIAVGPLFLGAPKSIRASISGERLGLEAFLYEEEGILLSRACGSSAWMFPYIVPDYEFEAYVFVRDKKHKWRSKSTEEILVDSNIKSTWDGYMEHYMMDPCFGQQEDQLAPPPIDKILAVYGINLRTEIFYFYKESPNGITKFELDSSGKANNFDCSGGIAYETKDTQQNKLKGKRRSGDGTVPYASLSYCTHWNSEIDVVVEELEGADHREILKDKSFTRIIVEYCCHAPAPPELPESFNNLTFEVNEIRDSGKVKPRTLSLKRKGILLQSKGGEKKYFRKYDTVQTFSRIDDECHIKFAKSSGVLVYQSTEARIIIQELGVRIKHIENSRPTVAELIDEKGQTELHIAVNENNIIVVRELLADERNVNAQDNQGWTPLHIACDKKLHDMILLLLREASIDVNIKSKGETNPLIYALRDTSEDCIAIWDAILQAGANINCRGSREMTPLHEVISRPPSYEPAKWLISKGANINAVNDKGDTPLHFATVQNDKRLIALLLEKGANRHIINKAGESPLRIAQNMSRDLLTFMLDYKPSGYSARATKDHMASSMEELSFYEGDYINHIEVLDDYSEGWWYGECGGLGGYFPSECIMDDRRPKFGESEPEDGPTDARDEYGLTSLHKAAMQGDCDAGARLIQQKANINAQDRNGWTPMHCAAREGKLEFLLLIAFMPALDLSKRNIHAATPLHYLSSINPTTRTEQKELLEILHRFKGTNIDAITNDGETPLHRAAFRRNTFVVKFLLENKANPNAVNCDDVTPLFYAVDERDKAADIEMIRMLLVYEADSSKKSKYGSPLEIALAGFNADVLQILQESKTGKLVTISQRNERLSIRKQISPFRPARKPVESVFPSKRTIIDEEAHEVLSNLLAKNFDHDLGKFSSFVYDFIGKQGGIVKDRTSKIIGENRVADVCASPTRKRATRMASAHDISCISRPK